MNIKVSELLNMMKTHYTIKVKLIDTSELQQRRFNRNDQESKTGYTVCNRIYYIIHYISSALTRVAVLGACERC